MSAAGSFVSDDIAPKFRRTEPARHRPPENATLLTYRPRIVLTTFAGDNENEFRSGYLRFFEETAEPLIRRGLSEAMEIYTRVDCHRALGYA